MKHGIKTFVGDRLRLARGLRGIPAAADLAQSLGVSRQTVSGYETGTMKPDPDRIKQIADVLGFPPGFFLMPLPDDQNGQPFFRSMASAVEAQRARSKSLLVALSDVTKFLTDYVDIPDPTLPKQLLPGGFRVWTNDQIEYAAGEVRRLLGVKSGPMPNLTALLEHKGVVIARDFLAERELDGLSDWLGGRPFALLNTSKSPARSRMDLAHELGHLCLHDSVDPAALVDKRSFALLEDQAFRFGRALLMPRDEFAFDVITGSLDELLALKPKWQVSVAAMLYRVGDLGILSERAYSASWIRRRRLRWHLEEPMEDAVRVEAPTVLASSAQVLRDEGGMAPEAIVEGANVPGEEFIRLANLNKDFLSPPANLLRLRS